MTTEKMISGRRMSPDTGVAVAGGEIVNSGEVGLASRDSGEGTGVGCTGAMVASFGGGCGSDTKTVGTSVVGDETRESFGGANEGSSAGAVGCEGIGA